MKGKIKTASKEILTILILYFILSTNSQAIDVSTINNKETIIIVDINGNGKYQSIQEAINNEKAGSKILIKIGTYPEILNIKKQIELIGEDIDNTIINPTSYENKYAININSENVKISYLNIENRGPGIYNSAIQITSPNITISTCKIHDTPIGIAIWTSNNTIQNCIFYNCNDEGIALLGTQESNCNNNKITNCIFVKNCDGIELQYSSKNTINNCDFYNNTHDGINAINTGNNNNTISNCNIYNNNVHGIYLSNSSGNKIINCYINENNDKNIYITQNSENNEIINTNNSIKNPKISNKISDLIKELIKTINNKKMHQTLNNILSLIESKYLLRF